MYTRVQGMGDSLIFKWTRCTAGGISEIHLPVYTPCQFGHLQTFTATTIAFSSGPRLLSLLFLPVSNSFITSALCLCLCILCVLSPHSSVFKGVALKRPASQSCASAPPWCRRLQPCLSIDARLCFCPVSVSTSSECHQWRPSQNDLRRAHFGRPN